LAAFRSRADCRAARPPALRAPARPADSKHLVAFALRLELRLRDASLRGTSRQRPAPALPTPEWSLPRRPSSTFKPGTKLPVRGRWLQRQIVTVYCGTGLGPSSVRVVCTLSSMVSSGCRTSSCPQSRSCRTPSSGKQRADPIIVLDAINQSIIHSIIPIIPRPYSPARPMLASALWPRAVLARFLRESTQPARTGEQANERANLLHYQL
jgi:hypothetical protein